MSDETFGLIVKIVIGGAIFGLVINLLPYPFRTFVLLGLASLAAYYGYVLHKQFRYAVLWFVGALFVMGIPVSCMKPSKHGGGSEDTFAPKCVAYRQCD